MQIFGKKRYFWFLEPINSIIYWSIFLTLIFSGLIWMLEFLGNYFPSIIMFLIALILLLFGFHRHFWLDEQNGILNIVSFKKSQRKKIQIDQITKVVIIKNYLIFYSREFSGGKECYNVPVIWRCRFTDDLSKNEHFQGQIID